MKHLFTILMLCISIVTFSQNFGNHDVGAKSKEPKDSTKTVKWYDDDYLSTISSRNNTSGQCLVAASNSQFGAYVASVVGSIMIVCSASGAVNDSQKDVCNIIGYTSIGVGLILQIRSTVLIGKAGKLMDEQQKSLTFRASITGVGLALNF